MWLHTQIATHAIVEGFVNLYSSAPTSHKTRLVLMKSCQLGFHVDVISLTVEGILQGFFISAPDLQQERPVCGEAVNECLENLAVGVQYQIGHCKAAPVRLSIRCLQPAIRTF